MLLHLICCDLLSCVGLGRGFGLSALRHLCCSTRSSWINSAAAIRQQLLLGRKLSHITTTQHNTTLFILDLHDTLPCDCFTSLTPSNTQPYSFALSAIAVIMHRTYSMRQSRAPTVRISSRAHRILRRSLGGSVLTMLYRPRNSKTPLRHPPARSQADSLEGVDLVSTNPMTWTQDSLIPSRLYTPEYRDRVRVGLRAGRGQLLLLD